MDRRSPLRTLAVTLLLSSLHLSCEEGGNPSPEVSRVDSAGREIVTSGAPAWSVGEAWTVDAEPVLSIGQLEGDDPYNLFRVSDVMRLDDGRIVIANGGTREVRVFDDQGTYLETVGGPGQGPGEFQYPSALLPRDGGGFRVVDFMSLEHFDADGGHVELEAFDRAAWMELTRPLGRSEGGSPLGDGRVLAPIYGSGFTIEGDPRPGPPFRPQITMVIVDLATGSIDTLAHVGGSRQQMVDVGSRVTPMGHPFSPSGRWFAGRDGSIVLYDGAAPEVQRLTPAGTHRILRWPAEPQPISEAEFKAWARERIERFPERRAELERGYAQMDRPTERAIVTGAHPSLDGSTWVRTGPNVYDATRPVPWQIFDAEGVWLGAVELPGGFQPHEITGEYLLGVERDSGTEVETVRMLRLEKPGEG